MQVDAALKDWVTGQHDKGSKMRVAASRIIFNKHMRTLNKYKEVNPTKFTDMQHRLSGTLGYVACFFYCMKAGYLMLQL